MADEIDRAQEREQQQRDAAIAAAGGKEIERGRAGKCHECGEPRKRLVHREGYGRICAACRDLYRLP